MARNKGQFNFSANLEVKKAAPLDARVVVNTLAELTSPATWQDDKGEAFLYEGIVVAVLENRGLYMLNDATGYSDIDNWTALDAKAAKIEVVADLNSTDNTKALAASQGKVLSDKIESLKTSLSSVYKYKGSVDSFGSLPAGAEVGDTYNVVGAYGNVPAGTNWAWNGDSWDALGGSVDLSDYYTKEQVDSAIEAASPTEELNTIKQSVKANTDALLVINGTEEGSLANTLKLAKDYTDDQLTAYVPKEEGASLISSEKLALIDTNASNIASLQTDVEANTAAINKLKADENTEGSILNIVNNNINTALGWKEID